MKRREWLALAAAGALLPGAWAQSPATADEALDETWTDPARQRSVPLRIRWPGAAVPPGGQPVVLFSHGLGGSRAGGETWGRAWAAAGLVVVHLQHPGSDGDALRGLPGGLRSAGGLHTVAGPDQLLARLADVVFVLDEIGRRHAARTGRWGEVRPTAVGLSGHSFGAHTTLGMAGQRYPGAPSVTEPRLASFIAFSPTIPARGDATRAFEGMTRPMLCLTGTRDGDVVGNGATPERRAAVYPALPAGRKAQLLLADADHMSFSGQSGRAAQNLRRDAAAQRLQPAHDALIASVTTQWWRATLMEDAAARAWLTAPAGLGAGDRWDRG